MTTIIRMRQKIVNPKAPYIPFIDPMESQRGSMFLWDGGLNPINGTVKDTLFSNLLESYAPATGKACTLKRGSFDDTRHDKYIARQITPKGGLHLIVSQTYVGDRYATLSYSIQANDALREAIRQNIMGQTPNLFVSVWNRCTRKAPSGSAPIIHATASTSSVVDGAFHKQTNQTVVQVDSRGVAHNHLNLTELDDAIVGKPNKHSFNLKGYRGTGLGATTPIRFAIAGYEAPWGGQYINQSPSMIVYRVYVEDLSLSGRTYEEVKAIDDAEFAKAFGVGGRFYGDTWSNPTTILP